MQTSYSNVVLEYCGIDAATKMFFNPFLANVLILYPLIQNGNTGQKWVNTSTFFVDLFHKNPNDQKLLKSKTLFKNHLGSYFPVQSFWKRRNFLTTL